MKKFLAVLLLLMVLFALTACGNTYKGPLSCISHLGTDGQIALIDYTEDVHKEILHAMNTDKWTDDVTNCGHDYEFEVDGATIRYHSECGTFIDVTAKRSMTLTDDERVEINKLLGASDGNKDTSPSNDQTNTITAYCYVLCVKSDGFVANINDVGDVFIKYANAKQHIEVFDTVIVEYDKADLEEKSGTYTDVSGEKATYSHKLTNPKNVRVADPSKGDLVFG